MSFRIALFACFVVFAVSASAETKVSDNVDSILKSLQGNGPLKNLQEVEAALASVEAKVKDTEGSRSWQKSALLEGDPIAAEEKILAEEANAVEAEKQQVLAKAEAEKEAADDENLDLGKVQKELQSIMETVTLEKPVEFDQIEKILDDMEAAITRDRTADAARLAAKKAFTENGIAKAKEQVQLLKDQIAEEERKYLERRAMRQQEQALLKSAPAVLDRLHGAAKGYHAIGADVETLSPTGAPTPYDGQN
jgi:hypothetical protein